MRASAVAQPNIALIKYWGKQDVAGNVPAVGSLSITLDSLETQMTVQFDGELGSDELFLNGEPAARMLPRVSRCLDDLIGSERSPARIESICNFPIAAGLASSASSFAALVVAASEAAGLPSDTLSLARAAGQASGSAARSLYGGFVELKLSVEKSPSDIAVASILDGDSWPMQVIVAITATGEKPISSGDAMNLSSRTSPFYASWLEHQDHDLAIARQAVEDRDFSTLAAISEHNCLKMHSVMWASRPPVVYWNKATLACMETVRRLQADGIPVFFTIDAGPQVKAVCLPDSAGRVREALRETEGVIDTMESSLGGGARLQENL
jgi:diphosphomevalonate decarboxylase